MLVIRLDVITEQEAKLLFEINPSLFQNGIWHEVVCNASTTPKHAPILLDLRGKYLIII